MLTVAVVILNWNGRKLLEQFLPSIVNYSTNEYTKIYVADNASTDDSISFIKKTFPTVSIILNKENGGYAKGYNDALKNINADVFALVNSDIEVTENWITPVVDYFLQQPEVSIIQPKIKDFKNKEYFEYAGAAGGFIDSYGYPFCRGRIFDTVEKDQNQYENTKKIFWASGACFFVRTSVFMQLNGFDESFFAHQEEIDFCWRAYNSGHQVYYLPSSEVYHVGGATLNEANPKKTYLNFRNSLYTLTKNLPKNKLM
ncbi:MAG: glycosyltransferase family 2 protein, partial [Bacteroidetes bacterium]|nr:glycosyltransferase family 2 protein [Bacteroidota bacterium]